MVRSVYRLGTLAAVLLAACTIAALGACTSGDGGMEPDPVQPDSVVSMPGFSFVPFSITIAAGRTVTFDFPAEPHNVIFSKITGAPADIQVTTSRPVSRRFDVRGNFPYDCTIHPGMSGIVVVE
jgi:plastocyanin